MKHTLDITTRTLSLVVPGDIVSTNAPALREEAFGILESETIAKADWQTLQLDLRGANMIDSMGLNLLVSIIKHARNRGAKIVGQVANTNVQRTICFTRLDTQMELIAA
jgi:anti-anti-sigma factor